VHWPLKSKHIYEKWRAETAWGKMFQEYQREGVLSK
jgi:hypothetical protein